MGAPAIPAIGASGAIAGVLGAYLILFPRAQVMTLLPIFVFITIREIPAIIILQPIFGEMAVAGGIDPYHMGIVVVLTLAIGLITPPVGMNLFVVHGIRPDKGGIEDAIWGALPYAAIMIVFAFPPLIARLPAIATSFPSGDQTGTVSCDGSLVIRIITPRLRSSVQMSSPAASRCATSHRPTKPPAPVMSALTAG
mgnify:CR=1 FL=1